MINRIRQLFFFLDHSTDGESEPSRLLAEEDFSILTEICGALDLSSNTKVETNSAKNLSSMYHDYDCMYYVLLSLRHSVSSSQHHHIRRELNSLPCFSGSRSVADAGTAHRCNVDDRPPMPLKVQICRYTVHIIHEREERMREAGRAFVG